jgi:hypothetical protein
MAIGAGIAAGGQVMALEPEGQAADDTHTAGQADVAATRAETKASDANSRADDAKQSRRDRHDLLLKELDDEDKIAQAIRIA